LTRSPADGIDSSAWHRPVALIVIALFIRVLACSHLECISRDGVQFVSFARQLAQDPLAAMRGTFKQPGMSILLLGTSRMMGRHGDVLEPAAWIKSGQMIAVAGGVLSCLFVYILAGMLFNREIAFLAGLLACFWPQGVELSAQVLSDMPHLALYLAALLLGLRAASSGRYLDAALCGGLAGLAYWVRQEALGVPIAVVIGILAATEVMKLKRRLTLALVLLASFIAIIAPQALAVGHVMPNKDLWQLFLGKPAETALPNTSQLLAEAIPGWKTPGRMIEQWGFSGRYVLSTLVLVGLFLRSAPIAIRSKALVVGAAIALQLVAVQLRVKSYGEISSRYVVIPAALTIPWAAAGMYALLTMIYQRSPKNAQWAVGLFLVIIFAPLGYCSERAINREGRAYREAGVWLGMHAGATDSIVAHERLEQLMFYAGRILPDGRWVRIAADASADTVASEINRTRPRWFADVRNSRNWSPEADSHYFEELQKGFATKMKEVFRKAAHDKEATVWEIP
jgi:hypothetical protein